jgi:hypothetical protein
MTRKFNTAAEARQIGTAMAAAGQVSAWCEYPCFGKFTLRVQIDGRWSNLRVA